MRILYITIYVVFKGSQSNQNKSFEINKEFKEMTKSGELEMNFTCDKRDYSRYNYNEAMCTLFRY